MLIGHRSKGSWTLGSLLRFLSFLAFFFSSPFVYRIGIGIRTSLLKEHTAGWSLRRWLASSRVAAIQEEMFAYFCPTCFSFLLSAFGFVLFPPFPGRRLFMFDALEEVSFPPLSFLLLSGFFSFPLLFFVHQGKEYRRFTADSPTNSAFCTTKQKHFSETTSQRNERTNDYETPNNAFL